jgi:hypothetical protein
VHAAKAEELGVAGALPSELEQFARKLQVALADRDSRAVAQLVAFPLRVNQHRHKPAFLTKSQFIARFNTVFTSSVSNAVSNQDPKALFQNSNGAMFGNGEVWIAGIWQTKSCAAYRLAIVSVNILDE